jgi:hypothetical protein
MPDLIYNAFKRAYRTSKPSELFSSLTAVLVTDAYKPDRKTHGQLADIKGEVVGEGYEAGGKPVPNVRFEDEDDGDEQVVKADDVLWPNSTIKARGAVIACASGLVCYFDFGKDKTSSDGTFKLSFRDGTILNFG